MQLLILETYFKILGWGLFEYTRCYQNNKQLWFYIEILCVCKSIWAYSYANMCLYMSICIYIKGIAENELMKFIFACLLKLISLVFGEF